MVWTKMILNMALSSALAGGFLLLGGATTVRADDDGCRRNVDKWEDKLERDVHRYGNYSRQATHDRHELGEARESCERRHDNDQRYRNDYDRDGGRR